MNEAMSGRRRAYDHRLQELVCEEGSSWLLQGMGVPRSTAASWLRRRPRAVVTLDVVTKDTIELQAEVIRLRQRNEVLSAIARLLFMLLRLAGVRLDETRIPEGAAKAKILAAIARARTTLQLAVVLRVLGLSPSRYHAWNRLERACQLDDRSTCPRTTPTQLTAEEVRTMHVLATSGSYRHMSVRSLALHAQRIGMLFASPATWGRLIRERGWLRPRARIHPATPKESVRATRPNELLAHRRDRSPLLDGTRLYLHAVIDNFSRRILAWSSLPGSSPNRPARFSPPTGQDSTSV
jgi:putative transposase